MSRSGSLSAARAPGVVGYSDLANEAPPAPECSWPPVTHRICSRPHRTRIRVCSGPGALWLRHLCFAM
ncbi:Hypothetical protein NTJ_05941 [Nesidiocoris tenuis]|uniref:Uncharacterized protein n=1 Tax=Nesidiocoris tenuis TaxID=355587 RepID=A0ABN7ALL2_9HEMI|nr:Hypothetical protein NTJ_05941 [Nesidiocoris tenuis]